MLSFSKGEKRPKPATFLMLLPGFDGRLRAVNSPMVVADDTPAGPFYFVLVRDIFPCHKPEGILHVLFDFFQRLALGRYFRMIEQLAYPELVALPNRPSSASFRCQPPEHDFPRT
ncbi:MAG: hypothetical protein HY671_08655 [Chloroflexi bacterium]|nr:hypothetical protein [Chloroflexota bacterium]